MNTEDYGDGKMNRKTSIGGVLNGQVWVVSSKIWNEKIKFNSCTGNQCDQTRPENKKDCIQKHYDKHGVHPGGETEPLKSLY